MIATRSALPSAHDLANRFAVVDVEAFAAGDLQEARVEAEQLQNSGVDVGDVVSVLGGVEAQLVGAAVDDAALDAAAGQLHREAVNVVIAAVGTLRARRAAELRGEDHERLFQQAAALEVFEQSRNWLVHLAAVLGVVGLEAAVRVPGPGAAGAVLHLNEADAALDEPP